MIVFADSVVWVIINFMNLDLPFIDTKGEFGLVCAGIFVL